MRKQLFIQSFVFIWLGLGLTSCAGRYGRSYQKGISVDENESTFSGNPGNSSLQAWHYSRLGAIEYCFKRGQLALLLNSRDESISQTYTQVYYLSSLKYMGSYPVTETHAQFVTPFHCVPRLSVVPGIETAPVSAELVHPFLHDFKGGILVTSIKSIPGKKSSRLRKGDVILSINGHRTADKNEMTLDVLTKISKDAAAFLIVRNNQKLMVLVPLDDLTVGLLGTSLGVIMSVCGEMTVPENRIGLCTASKEQWTAFLSKFLTPEFANNVYTDYILRANNLPKVSLEESVERVENGGSRMKKELKKDQS